MDIESLKDQNKNSPPMTRKRTKMLTEKKTNKKQLDSELKKYMTTSDKK